MLILFTRQVIYAGLLARQKYQCSISCLKWLCFGAKVFGKKLLIPAFVFFFQKLYPFPQVNNSQYSAAAAAGGCILVQREALAKARGILAIKERLIDDCSLTDIIKENDLKWLGLNERAHSLREYEELSEIWHMVARTALVQLNHSKLKLIGTVLEMLIMYIAAPLMTIAGLSTGNVALSLAGGCTWFLMAVIYTSTRRHYNLNLLWAILLPLSGLIYTAMTIDLARQHWTGRGGAWKGRNYPS
jgi:hopene-associated glycosyltransferase HpnB